MIGPRRGHAYINVFFMIIIHCEVSHICRKFERHWHTSKVGGLKIQSHNQIFARATKKTTAIKYHGLLQEIVLYQCLWTKLANKKVGVGAVKEINVLITPNCRRRSTHWSGGGYRVMAKQKDRKSVV